MEVTKIDLGREFDIVGNSHVDGISLQWAVRLFPDQLDISGCNRLVNSAVRIHRKGFETVCAKKNTTNGRSATQQTRRRQFRSVGKISAYKAPFYVWRNLKNAYSGQSVELFVTRPLC